MERKDLSAEGMYRNIREIFEGAPDHRGANSSHSLADVLMGGLAMFSMKSPSLLAFENVAKESPTVARNIQNLFGVEKVASDTSTRRILDEVEPEILEKPFRKLSSCLQRGKVFESYGYLGGHLLTSLDGTGYFSSNEVQCSQCCVKEHKDGTKTYFHNMLGAVVCHPDLKQVFPLTRPEPITIKDGNEKNDSEQAASLRCLERIRREHPHLKIIVLEDSLHSKGPHIISLKDWDMRFILSAKPGDHKKLFEFIEQMQKDGQVKTYECMSPDGMRRYRFRYYNGAPLNESHMDLDVNFLEFWEENIKTGKVFHSSWVTDFSLSNSNLVEIMKAGRARWRIENETFNVLKNHGYQFEHNFGHGYKNLSVILATLMMLAFAVDQIQEACCSMFQQALLSSKRKIYFWGHVRNRIEQVVFENWQQFYGVFTGQFKILSTLVDSS